MAEDPEERIACTQDSHLSGKPKCLITEMMVECSAVSNAFSKSSFSIIISLFDW
jgi:hypothetical protein